MIRTYRFPKAHYLLHLYARSAFAAAASLSLWMIHNRRVANSKRGAVFPQWNVLIFWYSLPQLIISPLFTATQDQNLKIILGVSARVPAGSKLYTQIRIV